jgi:hypothetical protein
MILANLLNNYPVYNNIKFFIILFALASNIPIAKAAEMFSYQNFYEGVSIENLGALVFNSDFKPCQLLLKEKCGNIDEEYAQVLPSIIDLILTNQYIDGLGVKVYVLELNVAEQN